MLNTDEILQARADHMVSTDCPTIRRFTTKVMRLRGRDRTVWRRSSSTSIAIEGVMEAHVNVVSQFVDKG